MSAISNTDVVDYYNKKSDNKKTFSEWKKYFIENGASYELACDMAKSKCMGMVLEEKHV